MVAMVREGAVRPSKTRARAPAKSRKGAAPAATKFRARAQGLLHGVLGDLALGQSVLHRSPGPLGAVLVRLGLLGYLAYSYLIYVTGVPMNRVFLAYVAIVSIAGGHCPARTIVADGSRRRHRQQR